MQTRIMQFQQLLGISGIYQFPVNTQRNPEATYWAEKNQIGSKISTHKKNQASASGPCLSKLKIPALRPSAYSQTTFLQWHGTPFLLKNRDI